MCEFLDMYLEGHEHIDNYRPEWLTNPSTGQRLEIDRYYPRFKVGYEYQGEQHLRQVEGFENIRYRNYLDGMKSKMAKNAGVEIVRVEPVELQIHPMLHKAKRAYRHLEKLNKAQGISNTNSRRIRKRHKKNMAEKTRRKKVVEISRRATAYRIWLEKTYGDQVGVHRKKTNVRRMTLDKYQTKE